MTDGLDIIRGAFDAFAAHDQETLARHLHDDIHVAAPVPVRPGLWTGAVEGRAEVLAQLRAVSGPWPRLGATLLEARDYGPGCVVAEGMLVFNGSRGNGFGSFAGWIFDLVGDSIARVETYVTREALADALTPRGGRS